MLHSKWIILETLMFLQISVNLKHPYVIKETPTISALRDFHVKVALYYQKCFSRPLVKNSIGSVEQPTL